MEDSGQKNKEKSSYKYMFDITLFPSYSLFYFPIELKFLDGRFSYFCLMTS